MQHRWLPNSLFYKSNIICFKLISFVLFFLCFIIINNTKGNILMYKSLLTLVFTSLEYIYICSDTL